MQALSVRGHTARSGPRCGSAAFVRKHLLPRDQHGNLGPTNSYTPILRYTTLLEGKRAGIAARGSNGQCGRTGAFATPCPTSSPGQGHAFYSACRESRSHCDPVQPLAPPNAPPLPPLVVSCSESSPTRPTPLQKPHPFNHARVTFTAASRAPSLFFLLRSRLRDSSALYRPYLPPPPTHPPPSEFWTGKTAPTSRKPEGWKDHFLYFFSPFLVSLGAVLKLIPSRSALTYKRSFIGTCSTCHCQTYTPTCRCSTLLLEGVDLFYCF